MMHYDKGTLRSALQSVKMTWEQCVGVCANIAIGLRNIHERLAVQFGSRASLRATADAGTWIATIRLPLLRERP